MAYTRFTFYDPTHRHSIDDYVGYSVIRTKDEDGAYSPTLVASVDGASRYAAAVAEKNTRQRAALDVGSREWFVIEPVYACRCTQYPEAFHPELDNEIKLEVTR
ncbi:hypothetical protein ACFY05_32455 [Microtetraspora fusca]|uniref:DUF3892 domain-containing protein n=1 Tax=Microtetraspora fusca TaxID=1997 RepID=A0ABW6VEB4_MICFU